MRTLTHYMGCRNLLSSSRAVLAAEEFESREYQITSSLTLSIACEAFCLSAQRRARIKFSAQTKSCTRSSPAWDRDISTFVTLFFRRDEPTDRKQQIHSPHVCARGTKSRGTRFWFSGGVLCPVWLFAAFCLIWWHQHKLYLPASASVVDGESSFVNSTIKLLLILKVWKT